MPHPSPSQAPAEQAYLFLAGVPVTTFTADEADVLQKVHAGLERLGKPIRPGWHVKALKAAGAWGVLPAAEAK